MDETGLGKGITASSIGLLLKEAGLRVTAIKIDPYLNIDAGIDCLSFPDHQMYIEQLKQAQCHLMNMVKSLYWMMEAKLI